MGQNYHPASGTSGFPPLRMMRMANGHKRLRRRSRYTSRFRHAECKKLNQQTPVGLVPASPPLIPPDNSPEPVHEGRRRKPPASSFFMASSARSASKGG